MTSAGPRGLPAVMDLRPAAKAMAGVLATLTDSDLDRPTPCDCTVASLATHVGGLTVAFTAAARKELGPLTGTAPPAEMPADLPPDWRTSYPTLLDELADAWTVAAAWEGTTQAGGVDLAALEAGAVALDELVLHAWDLSVATGRVHRPDEVSLGVVEQFVASFPADPAARGGIFGPPLPFPADADRFDKVLAMAGRDPRWGR
jgi:uncharacterized protein (TIGR03086 family)